MKQALVIVDVQNDYFEGGNMQLRNSLKALANIEKVLGMFRERNLPVIHMQHVNKKNDAFFVPDTFGVQIHKNLTPLENEYHIIKHMPNSFLGTGLQELVWEAGITDMVVCGMMTNMCIDSTVRACTLYKLNVVLLDDACAASDLNYNGEIIPAETVHKTFMASMNGFFAKVINTCDFQL